MIVKTIAVPLNPTDWKALAQEGNEGTISGVDFSGIVVEVGSKIKNFKKGDRVCGCSVGGMKLLDYRKSKWLISIRGIINSPGWLVPLQNTFLSRVISNY